MATMFGLALLAVYLAVALGYQVTKDTLARQLQVTIERAAPLPLLIVGLAGFGLLLGHALLSQDWLGVAFSVGGLWSAMRIFRKYRPSAKPTGRIGVAK
jgi:hypothetical protein